MDVVDQRKSSVFDSRRSVEPKICDQGFAKGEQVGHLWVDQEVEMIPA